MKNFATPGVSSVTDGTLGEPVITKVKSGVSVASIEIDEFVKPKLPNGPS